jgi:hypothetical protein
MLTVTRSGGLRNNHLKGFQSYTLVEELPATGEWAREERDLWTRWFLRTLDKLYKVKE